MAPEIWRAGHECTASIPRRHVLDSADNLYIADVSNNRVVRVDAATGILILVAGNGAGSSSGDGGAATLASINRPRAVALNPAGNLFISEFMAAQTRLRRRST